MGGHKGGPYIFCNTRTKIFNIKKLFKFSFCLSVGHTKTF